MVTTIYFHAQITRANGHPSNWLLVFLTCFHHALSTFFNFWQNKMSHVYSLLSLPLPQNHSFLNGAYYCQWRTGFRNQSQQYALLLRWSQLGLTYIYTYPTSIALHISINLCYIVQIDNPGPQGSLFKPPSFPYLLFPFLIVKKSAPKYIYLFAQS